MRVKLYCKEISSEKEEAMANFIKYMIDGFMFLVGTINELEELEEKEEK